MGSWLPPEFYFKNFLAGNLTKQTTTRTYPMNTILKPNQPVHALQSPIAQCVASCRKLLQGIEHAKTRIVAEFQARLAGQEHLLELAINEAEALAWESGFPQLLFPTLALEKAHAVAAWQARQDDLRRRSASLAFAA
jgi:hypothetical protein